MLDRLTVDAFAPAVGDAFVTGDGVRFELVEAATQAPGAPAVDDQGRRTPFAVLFRGPAEPLLTQGIHAVEHPDLGTLELFLVPVGRDAAGVRYEAVFG